MYMYKYITIYTCACIYSYKYIYTCTCRSEGQTCGVCMDVVLNKPIKSDRRFGILCM